jgi:hypothetical protein
MATAASAIHAAVAHMDTVVAIMARSQPIAAHVTAGWLVLPA